MATVEPRYPSLEEAFVALLDAPVGWSSGTDLPLSLGTEDAVFHRVSRGPGSDDGTTDEALVDVETFSKRRDDAEQAAEEARQLIHGARASRVAGALLDDVRTAAGPSYLDYNNPHLKRYVASYRVGVRRTHTGGTP